MRLFTHKCIHMFMRTHIELNNENHLYVNFIFGTVKIL